MCRTKRILLKPLIRYGDVLTFEGLNRMHIDCRSAFMHKLRNNCSIQMIPQ